MLFINCLGRKELNLRLGLSSDISVIVLDSRRGRRRTPHVSESPYILGGTGLDA